MRQACRPGYIPWLVHNNCWTGAASAHHLVETLQYRARSGMFSSSIRTPPFELERAATLLQQMLIAYVSACNQPSVDFRGLHSHKTSFLLMVSVIRHIEAVTQLAKQDTYMLKPATSAARSAFESSLYVLWMLAPEETSQREQRWLRYMRGVDDYYDRTSKLYKQFGEATDKLLAEQAQLQALIGHIMYEYRFGKLKELPDIRGMLKSIGEERKYILYVLLSQFTHSDAMATLHSHGSPLADEPLFETADIEGWSFVLTVCWWCLWKAGNRVLQVSDLPAFTSVSRANMVRKAIRELTDRSAAH